MTPYHLAKLVAAAGEIDTRKRMQKLVFMLKAAGCPFDADFFLHRFGPYSQDVAELTDTLVTAGVLQETQKANPIGKQFGYRLTDLGRTQIAEFEQKHPEAPAGVKPYLGILEKLKNVNLRTLEVASTIAYFKQSSSDWNAARTMGCSYKSVAPDSEDGRKAEQLAKSVLPE